MTAEETALEIVEFFEEQPGSHRRAVMEDMIVAALRERDAAWVKATVGAWRCSQDTRCSVVRMDWYACDRCAPLRALLEETGSK